MEPTDPPLAQRALRARAEQRLLAEPDREPGAAPTALQQAMQELQVHQVELQVQYEELLVAQAQTELSRAQYISLYNAAPVGYCILSRRGELHRLNQSAARLLGRPVAALLGRQLALCVEADGRGILFKFLQQLWQHPSRHHSCELPLRQPGGQLLHVQLEGTVAFSPDGEQEEVCHLALFDVSARHAATAALAASEVRFRVTFEQSCDGMILLDDQHFVDANNAALRLLGLTGRAQLLGRPLGECWPATQPDGRPTLEILHHCLAEAEAHGWCRVELLRHSPAGAPVWDELSFNPITLHGKSLLHATWRDITARQHTEQQLRHSEAQLQQALAAAGVGVWSYDLASHIVQLDARAQDILGLPTGLPFELLKAAMHPDDLPRVEQALQQALLGRQPFEVEHRLLRAEGTVRYVAASGRFDYDEATGEARCLRALVRDSTARRQAELELSYKNRLLHNLLSNAPVVLARLGPDGRFRQYTGPPLRRLGLADNELVGRLATEVFPQRAAQFGQLLAGEPVSYTTLVEWAGQAMSLRVFGFFDVENQEGVLFGTDITEEEHLKEEATRLRLRQQQELHAVILTTQEEERRRIAESLHNGVGQLLYATRLHLDLLPPSEGLRTSQDLLNEAIRAVRLVSFELTPSVLQDFGLPAALRELAKRIPPAHFALDLNLTNLDQPLPAPLQTAIYRIVQELLNNAIKHAQAQEVFVSLVREDNQLYLSVEDDGVGLGPDTLATADAVGIGLVGIRTRVGLLGGTFEVKSRPGQGTGIFLQLPVGPPH